MDFHCLPSKTQLTQRHQLFIEIQNHCPLCDQELVIHIRFQPDIQCLIEEAECPRCGVTTRTKDHRIH